MSTNKSKRVVTYIKLPAYQIPFITKRHGSPMSFGSLSRYQVILENQLISNPKFDRAFTNLSCSQHAYELKIAMQSNQLAIFDSDSLPTLEDMDSMVAVYVPDYVIEFYSDGSPKGTNGTNKFYQLTRGGAQKFRKEVNKEFWMALGQYIYQEQNSRNPLKDKDNSVPSRKDLVLKFISKYHIDIEHFDNIYRNLARNLDNLEI